MSACEPVYHASISTYANYVVAKFELLTLKARWGVGAMAAGGGHAAHGMRHHWLLKRPYGSSGTFSASL